ncbi:hypothetical protein [Komagataeibacter oboediens]|uniref:hypothetical protein n=1 Tax=Komagataeibacter oboediens TaxID=65958 RepID=UPI001C2C8106|nr:hypothetical protein [Komagataeibacter oboediens]MCK9819057.1 hypothetical protein [Komagataeibacter oboediens]
MNRRQDRSLWARVDGAIVNSGIARLCRACLAVRYQSMEDPAFTCRIWGLAVRLWVAFVATLRALVAPARLLPAKLVPVTVNTSLPIRPFSSAFVSLDEHDLAVRRISSGACYIATTIIIMPGFLTLTAQAVLDIRLLHDVGHEVAAFLLFGCIAMVNIPYLCRATQCWAAIVVEWPQYESGWTCSGM